MPKAFPVLFSTDQSRESRVSNHAHRDSRRRRDLAFSATLGWKPEELSGFDPQDIHELPDNLDADVGHFAFDLADVGPVDSSLMRQGFLRNPFLMPDPAQIGGKELA